MAGATIQQEQWDLLPEKDQLLLKKMGVTVKKAAPPKTMGLKNPVARERKFACLNTAPKEYYIQIVSCCECCDGVIKKEGKMTLLEPRARQLNFVEQEVPAGETMKQKKLYPINCPQCEKRLGELDKKELVAKVMAITKLALFKGWL